MNSGDVRRRRVLIAHPQVSSIGGGNAVAAWVLHALRDHCDLALTTLTPVDCDALNRRWGTSLSDADFRVHLPPARYRRLLRAMPTPAALLEGCLTMRLAQNLDRRNHYDVVISTHNEADLGRRGICYVHYPWASLPRPEIEMRWYHHIPGALRAYRLICRRIARGSNEGLRRNLLIANSTFIAKRIRQAHGVESIVIYPPVTGEFPTVPWEDRRNAIIGVGRMHPCKRWEDAITIVDELRRRGRAVDLTLAGHRDDSEYLERLERLAATRPWLRIQLDLGRSALADMIVRHRYGIHTMHEEHFGMGPAEILRAGNVVFTHDSGGPIEILGDEERLMFHDVAEATEKIDRVLCDPTLQHALRARLDQRRHLFGTDTFCRSIREIVDTFPGL